MATILLSAVGAAIGGTFGGTILGLTGTVIGKAAGASIGGAIDQKIMGSGSRVVETGRIETFRLQGASEGVPVQRVMGRMRIAGQLIWSSKFREHVTTSTSGGKATSKPKVTTNKFSYSISLAIALGDGVVDRVGRIWADGQEIAQGDLKLAFYPGDEVQMPDPTISALEGIENTPLYRGTAYVVLEDIDLEPFGNRIPQFNFEVYRKAQPTQVTVGDPGLDIQGVCLIPGTGEYGLATTPVHYPGEFGDSVTANVHTGRGETDVVCSLADLQSDLPNCGSVSLVVSWFGDNLRCGDCTLRPKVEQKLIEGAPIPWEVAGEDRQAAEQVSYLDERPVFGGTPADAAVIESIAKIHELGKDVVFYPFVLMDVQAGNALGDPWSGDPDQPVMPWRGRITTVKAPGQPGSTDGTTAAASEVSAFSGVAQVSDFAVVNGQVIYSGPPEWSFRRFILHYAHLCVAAGGVEGFNIGSEMRALTQIRDGVGSFPAVAALQQLAQDVRSIVGPATKIGYAADWSEYFGYHPQDASGDVYFHLDPLWAESDIDYIGIDNYMPLSDWRDTDGHLDEAEGSLYSLGYLSKNIAGGEGFDWYYPDSVARDLQNRVPITDGAYGQPWVFRYKDLINWWSNAHHNRVGGIRDTTQTAWVPESKPIYFTELGCPAVDKGTNQPNVFIDPKSSESAQPYYSNGGEDSFIQRQYLLVVFEHWQDPVKNPTSAIYGGPMVDLARAHVWAWDVRPWPEFPGNLVSWSDGENYARGHWLNGRMAMQPLAAVVSEVCEYADVKDIDVGSLFGDTSGFAKRSPETGRQSLQPLMMAYDFSCSEIGGVLKFYNRREGLELVLDPAGVVVSGEEPAVVKTRQPEAETSGRVRVSFWDEARDYQTGTAEYTMADDGRSPASQVELPMVIKPGAAANMASRWLNDARVARDEVKLTLPPSIQVVTAGDVIRLVEGAGEASYRIERIEEQGARTIAAVRMEQKVFKQKNVPTIVGGRSSPLVPLPVHSVFLDLPILRDNQNPVAPYVGATANPWPGGVAVYSSSSDDGYVLNTLVDRAAVIGITTTNFDRSEIGRWSDGQVLGVRFSGGDIQSRTALEVLNGANVMAIGDGVSGWEVLQFRDADLQPDGSYLLSGFLRGQLGTDGQIPDTWGVGSRVVALDESLSQIAMADADRGLERHFRVGPVSRPVSDASFAHSVAAFDGVALRPYAPVHLRQSTTAGGDQTFTWVRRTREGGDSWQGFEVPLGETTESYQVQVNDDGTVLRAELVSAPSWTYGAADIAADNPGVDAVIEIAQISEKFGPGSIARMNLNV
ncbi:MAG: host specificity protein [Rhodobacteraceae bacterium]|nr:host specificity protein [Paracoccaceae bacterium]